MINKNLAEITLMDLQELISNSIHEGKTIDFKQEYSLAADKDKGEFLADVSSFANSLGGDLIIGIKEEAGMAKEITGFIIDNVDEEKQKIENIVRDGISPRITIDLRFLDIGEKRYVLILRIAKSWSSPNRIIFNKYNKTKDQFYSRNSAGKYPLDVVELRNAFTLSDTLIDKIKNFRIQRISAIFAGDTPVPLDEGGKIVLHLIPVESLTPSMSFSISGILKNPGKLSTIYSLGFTHRINLDGFLTFSGGRNERSHSYTQLYRKGIIEAVEARILGNEKWKEREGGRKFIPSLTYEAELLKSLKDYLAVLKEIGVSPPIFIFLTIIGAKNFEMGVDRAKFWDDHYKIDRDVLNLPEQLLEGYSEKVEDILRPMFDLIWNACGFQRSFNFDENGNWIGQ